MIYFLKHYKKAALLSLVALTASTYAYPAHSDKPYAAAECKTLECVRTHIDQIDQQLVQLIGNRLTYVKRAGELKKGRRPVHDQAREDKILTNVGKQAEQVGYPSTIAVAVFKTLLQQTNKYELESQQ